MAILEDLILKYPKERTLYIELGDTLYLEKGEYDKAISLFDKAFALFPYDSYIVNTMSGPLAAIGRPDLAIERLKSFLARVPDDANSYDTLGLMYILSGDLDLAIASFNDALAIRPDFSGSAERSVYPFALREDYQEVLSRLDRIISVAQVPLDQFRARLYKAFILFWLGSPTKALAALDVADKLADEFKLPANYRLYVPFLRSWLDLEGGEIEKGRQEAEIMREINRAELNNNPSLEASWKAQGELALAFAELKTGRLESAKKRREAGKTISEKIESPFSRNPVGHQLNIVSAELELKEGRAESAAASFDRLAPYEFFPIPHQWGPLIVRLHLPSQQDIKARAHVQLKEFDKAIAEYERLITFDPKSRERFLIHPVYHYRLAKLYQQKGIKDKAKAQYERFLDLWKDADPGRPEVEDAKKRVAALS